MKLIRCFVALGLLAVAAPCRAEMVTATFQGTDTVGGGNVPISGSLTYDTQATWIAAYSGPLQPGNLFTTTGDLTITQGNHTYSTSSVPFLVTLTGRSIYFQEETPGSTTITLQIGDGTNPLFPSISALPNVLSLSGTTGTYDIFTPGGEILLFASQGALTSLSMDPSPTAPEPGSLALLATGLAGLGLAVHRGRNRASGRSQ